MQFTSAVGSMRLTVQLQMLLSHFFLGTAVQATPGLVLPVERNTGLGCIPVGMTVYYECTVNDDDRGNTVWQGSVFNCPSPSAIILAHFLYESTGSTGSCGKLSAMSVGVSGNEYTSRLNLTATLELNEMTIECTVGGSMIIVGSDILRTGAIPLSPQNDSVPVVIMSSSSLTINWTPPIDATNVGGYMFTVTGDCGDCENINVSSSTTGVICSEWTASGQTCSFEVRTISQDCGFTSTNRVVETVKLAVPGYPSGFNVSLVYCLNGSLQYIDVEFTDVEPIIIGGGVPNEVNYEVMIGSQPFTGAQCNTSNQQCILRVPGSNLTEVGLLNVSVVAFNAVGSGNPTTFPMSVPTNLVVQKIVRVAINVANRVVSCQLLDSFPDTTPFVCSITYGPSPNNCNMYTNSSMPTTGRPRNTVTVGLQESLLSQTDYCYIVSVSYGVETLMVNGVFRTMCNPEELGSDPTSTNSSGKATILSGRVEYDGVTPGSIATLMCNREYEPATGSSNRTCMDDGNWSGDQQSCTTVREEGVFQLWIIAIIVFGVAMCGGIGAGYVCGVCCQLLYKKIRQNKCTTILLELLLCIAFGFELGLLLSYCCCGRKKKCKEDKRQLGKEESRKTPPPPDSLYADPNTIEHQAAPGTEDQYAMVDRKVKKNTKPKPTPPETLYQDPSTIKHETAVSGDTYAVVDKPKMSSKKGPDVIPPASEGLTYADIDLSTKRPKPGSDQQAAQQPGEYPVEYSSVEHGSTS